MQRHWVDVLLPITYGKQVEHQHAKAGYHVGSECKSGSKPEGCYAKERALSQSNLCRHQKKPVVGCGVELWTRGSA